MALRVLLADDHEIMRQGLRVLLEKNSIWRLSEKQTMG